MWNYVEEKREVLDHKVFCSRENCYRNTARISYDGWATECCWDLLDMFQGVL